MITSLLSEPTTWAERSSLADNSTGALPATGHSASCHALLKTLTTFSIKFKLISSVNLTVLLLIIKVSQSSFTCPRSKSSACPPVASLSSIVLLLLFHRLIITAWLCLKAVSNTSLLEKLDAMKLLRDLTSRKHLNLRTTCTWDLCSSAKRKSNCAEVMPFSTMNSWMRLPAISQ